MNCIGDPAPGCTCSLYDDLKTGPWPQERGHRPQCLLFKGATMTQDPKVQALLTAFDAVRDNVHVREVIK
jgi:hypothetical protein